MDQHQRPIALPLSVAGVPGGYKVVDVRGEPLAFVCAAEETRLSALPDLLSYEEAEDLANSIARALMNAAAALDPVAEASRTNHGFRS
jgi:hypothetical protein